MVKINKLNDDDGQKSIITNFILRELPDWFEIEESIVEYAEGVKGNDFYGAYFCDSHVGFISIKPNNIYTSEIYVMGILKDFHNRGIGKKLLETAQKDLVKNKVRYLMVKTLGDSHPDENYKNTRAFYKSVGFYPLEELKEIWGTNPCLIMAKNL